jgi:hypothetical protein
MAWDAYQFGPSAPRITSLLRALVKWPRNAARIEHVELQACNFQPYGDREDDETAGRPANCHGYSLRASDKPAFERDLTRMGWRNVDTWLTALFVDNDLRALMAVLLMRCTRLKSLNVASELFLTVFSDPGTWLPSMLNHCLSAPASSDRGLSRFHDLKSVVITGPTNECRRKLPPDVIKCLFRIPSLLTLEIACCPDLSTRMNEDVRPEIMAGCIALDRLAVLRLPLAAASPRTLKALLQFTSSLKTLVYDVLMPVRSFSDEHFADALATVPETLEVLVVRVHMYSGASWFRFSHRRPVRDGGVDSLQRLRNLRSLTIPPCLLFGFDPLDPVVPQLADVLPFSIESLHLVGDLAAFQSARLCGARVEAILRSFLAGQERADKPWSHRCLHGGVEFEEGERGCKPVWVYQGPPTWKSGFSHLERITVVEDYSGYFGGEDMVTNRRRCEALNEMMSDQGLDLVYIEVDDYRDIQVEYGFE